MSDLFLYKRKGRKVQINITSLIDVLFLLLIFFMVTSTFEKTTGIKVALPNIKKGVRITKKEVLEIIVTKNNRVFVDGKETPVGKLSKIVKQKKAENSSLKIFLKADKKAAYGFVVNVMNELRLAGVKNVAAIADELKAKAKSR